MRFFIFFVTKFRLIIEILFMLFHIIENQNLIDLIIILIANIY